MNKYHTGYYLSFSGKNFSPDEYSDQLIKENHLKLLPQNYKANEWFVEWIYNEKWHGLEFILNAKSFEVAQNVLCNVLCSSAVIEGTVVWSNDVHYPHDYGAMENNDEDVDQISKPIYATSNHSIPEYFYLTMLASKDNKLANSIVKYQLSTEIYSQHHIDLHEVIDWKTTQYNYTQMRFAYAIITAYSVIEELGLEVRASKEKPRRLANGEWNPEVLNDLIKRLESSNIQVNKDMAWMIRGKETEIEIKSPIRTTRLAEWAHSDDYDDTFFIRIKDGYVYLPDAIDNISFLRSKISSHSVGERIMNLSVFDVANAQNLARRLILQLIGQWK